MSELNQILEYEQQKKEEIAQARQAAQEAIQKKREQLEKKLVADVGVTASEGQEIVQKAKAKIKDFENQCQKQQKEGMDSLLNKKSAKLAQAVDLIVADFKTFKV